MSEQGTKKGSTEHRHHRQKSERANDVLIDVTARPGHGDVFQCL